MAAFQSSMKKDTLDFFQDFYEKRKSEKERGGKFNVWIYTESWFK